MGEKTVFWRVSVVVFFGCEWAGGRGGVPGCREPGTSAIEQNPMTTDGVVPRYYSIHVFALRAGCGAAYPTTNTARRDPPLPCWERGGYLGRQPS